MHQTRARKHIPPNTMPTMAPVGKSSLITLAKLGVPIGLIAVVVSITVAILEFILLLGSLVYFLHATLDIIYIRVASAIT